MSYLEDTLELDFIDIYTDNLILYRNNQCEGRECIENVINRLSFLKKNAPLYFGLIETNYLYEYTSRVFTDYHHSDVIKNYNKFTRDYDKSE